MKRSMKLLLPLFYSFRILLCALLLSAHMTVFIAEACLSTPCKSISELCNTVCQTIKLYPIRSQSRHKDRIVAGTTRFTHQHDDEALSLVASSISSYNRSFNAKEILEVLLGTDLQLDTQTTNINTSARVIHIQGGFIMDRDPRAWLADYFYLPRDFDAYVSFKPRITNFIQDWDFYFELNPCMHGMYARITIPLVHTQWDLNMCETVSINAESDTPENGQYPMGYFTSRDIPKDRLVQTFVDYMNGQVPRPIIVEGEEDEDPAAIEGRFIFQPIRFARMLPCVAKETRIADVRLEFGWNILQCERHHIGVNIQGAIPFGTRRKSCLLFEPQVGNGHHWEFGGGLTAHYRFYASEDERCSFAFYADANITHLFKTRQLRTFELKGKPNSAYMLATKFGPNIGANSIPEGQILRAGGGVELGEPVSSVFAVEYAPLANITTLSVNVSADLQADIVLMLSFHSPNFSIDIGYDLWARSTEIISFRDRFNDSISGFSAFCDPLQQNVNWALKGDARMIGFQDLLERPFAPIPLSATQSKADIHNGTNRVVLDINNPDDININIDNPALADVEEPPPGSGIDREVLNGFDPDTLTGGQRINTSLDPIFLTYSDLDFVGSRQISHKVFANFILVCEKQQWHPFIGAGGSVEIGRNKTCDNHRNCPTNPESRIDFALSQWSIWIKGGVAFN